MAIQIPGQNRRTYGTVRVQTVPTAEPVTVAEAKDHLRVTSTDDDTYIETLITVAREMVETYTRTIWTEQTLIIDYDQFPAEDTIEIGSDIGWVKTLESVRYFDKNDVDTLYDASNYYFDGKSKPARIIKKTTASYPETSTRPAAVYIEVTTNPQYTPKAINQAILLLVGHYYENRQEVTDRKQYTIPKAVDFLLSPYRNFEA